MHISIGLILSKHLVSYLLNLDTDIFKFRREEERAQDRVSEEECDQAHRP